MPWSLVIIVKILIVIKSVRDWLLEKFFNNCEDDVEKFSLLHGHAAHDVQFGHEELRHSRLPHQHLLQQLQRVQQATALLADVPVVVIGVLHVETVPQGRANLSTNMTYLRRHVMGQCIQNWTGELDSK